MAEANRKVLEDFDLTTGKELSLFEKTGKGYERLGDIITQGANASTESVLNNWSQVGKFADDYNEKVKELNRQNDELNEIISRSSDEFSDIRNEINDTQQPLTTVTNNFDALGDKLYKASNAGSSLNRTLRNLPNKTISWSANSVEVSGYATGGYPTEGEVFLARENGPELVGRKSAVANNDQIIEGIRQGVSQGVAEAMPSQQRGPINVYVGNRKVYSGYGEYANEENNMYGTNVIRV